MELWGLGGRAQLSENTRKFWALVALADSTDRARVQATAWGSPDPVPTEQRSCTGTSCGSVSSTRKPAARSGTEPVAAWPCPGAACSWRSHSMRAPTSSRAGKEAGTLNGVTQSRAADLRA